VIVNTASVAAQDGQIGQVAYAATKGGIYGMTLPMARDLAREGVRVNTILPGFFETPIYQQMPPEVKTNLASHLQFPQRFGTPAEYADLVAFMVTNGYINAECVRLDAGARMPPK
jgi:NAD(P)-dependent dehydrogenase (short-subunit alcohol dehydrogenase family)